MTKTVLITGISSGFGKAIAEQLSASGYNVYGFSRKQKEDLTGKIKVLQADVTDVSSIKKGIDTLIAQEGKLDILINNAGMGISGSIEDSSKEAIRLQMETNFMGYVNMIQAVLPAMRNQKSGTIVNISSIGGLMGLPYQGFYAASKFAVEGLSESLRMELKPFKIKIVVIQPGDFLTSFTANRQPEKSSTGAYQEQFDKTLAMIEKDEKGGLKPEYLAKKLAKILEKKNPCHSYIIATLEQKMAVVLKRILPGSWFSAILSDHYGIK